MPIVIGSSSNGIVAKWTYVKFTFVDDPQWRASITSAIVVAGSSGQSADWTAYLVRNVAGEISIPNVGYYPGGRVYEWTIKATGYPDTTVTVVVQ
ncbi:hemoblobin-interacting domain-containing protein [Lysinibacillus sp. 54212]|uniref:hemoblobin-interacting domain-containing protein n=1 Tax=Lysinibacillus sp. 54212 TaxID=3119829 RepID=UPI003FA5542B